MIKQGLPKLLADVVGRGRALEVHGGKLGEGVFVQVVFAEAVLFHGEVIDVDLRPSTVKVLTAEICRVRHTLKKTIKNVQNVQLLNLVSWTLPPSIQQGKEIKEAVHDLLI